MSKYALRLYSDTLAAKTALPGDLPAGNRIIYVREGSATLRSAGQAMTLAVNSAWCARTPCQVVAGANGAQILRWELGGPGVVPTGEGVQSLLLQESELDLDAPDGFLFRCDRVDFPPRGIAYTHTHQGPGIRCLLKGELTVAAAGHSTEIVPGGAWFESGPDPVLATAWNESPTAFVRVMVLPRSLKGKSSIRYVKPEDQQKPKPQQYQIFVDEFINL
jgi:quercetin dioxygenase-like cupin family protein